MHADGSVSFHLAAPTASTVALALEGTKAPLAMHREAGGDWLVTTPPLAPEWYSYHFSVDGRNALDTLNPTIKSSYTAAGNGFLVPGSGPRPWETSPVPHGTVHHHTYTTAIVTGLPHDQSEFYVYTPPGYDPRAATRYPVLYLLHGWSDTAAGWTNIGHANDILDNLIAAGKARPMIVVMPLGYGEMSFVRSGFGVWKKPAVVDRNTELFSQALLTEIVPQVEKLYSVAPGRDAHAIAGLSMGGLEALTIGLDHTEQFAWVGGFSAAVHLLEAPMLRGLDPKTANLKLVYIGCGTGDDLIEPNRRLAAALKAEGLPVVTSEVPDGLHTWLVWRPELVEFAAAIFQK